MSTKPSPDRLISTYIDDPQALWLRGNLHMHSTRTDGQYTPQELVERYAALGHDFMAFTDHDYAPLDSASVDTHGMILIPATEVSASGPHILALGIATAPAPQMDRQAVINTIVDGGGLAVVCHPNWESHFNHCSIDKLIEWQGYWGVEVFNGGTLTGEGGAHAMYKWDQLLSRNRRPFALATDDAHHAHHIGLGYCVVRARERSLTAIMEALRQGSFYASTGVEIASISVQGRCLHLDAPNAEAFEVIGVDGLRLAYMEGNVLDYEPAVGVEYFRVQCFGRGDRMAWTQPFEVDDEVKTRRQKLMAERITLSVPQLQHAPHMDGSGSDPLWQQAAYSGRFLTTPTGLPAEPATEMRVAFVNGELLLAITCHEPVMAGLRLKYFENGLRAIWTDDAVAIFIDMKGTAIDYAHIMVNAAGAYIAKWQGANAAGRTPPRLRAVAQRYNDRWSVELAIPLAELEGTLPTAETPWGFNVVRGRHADGDQHFTWNFLGSFNNHLPERFGRMICLPTNVPR